MADADGWIRVVERAPVRRRSPFPAALLAFAFQPLAPAEAVYTVDTSAEMEVFRNVITQDVAEPPLFELPQYCVVNDIADLEVFRNVITDDGGYPPQGNVPTQFIANAWVSAWDGPRSVKRPINVSLPQSYVAAWQGNVPTVFAANAWVAMWDGPPRKPFPWWAQQDVARRLTYFVQIVSQPSLRARDADATLLGEQADPTLLGEA